MILNNFIKKESDYTEKIKKLESQIAGFDKFDIQLLQKQNKEYESQISQVNSMISKITEKHNFEQNEFNEIATEVIVISFNLVIEAETE
jgi:predicted  nucleic acid-binding Zn-ribbon protein